MVPAFTPVAGVIDGALVATGTCPDSTRAILPALVCASQTLVSGPSYSISYKTIFIRYF